MGRKIVSLMIAAWLWGSAVARADFKYTESSQITGGMMVGMLKVAGVFSKEAKQARGPMQSTTYVKGNRMRTDDANGEVKIMDLDGRRIIALDPKTRTYSVVTFDQMRAAMEQARAKAEQQAQQRGGAKNANVKMTPKIEISPTGSTRTILNQPTKEVKVRMEMEMQSDDPKLQGQKASFWFTSDAWVAPSVRGYEEMRQFRTRLAKELDWLPGAVFGGNPQISPAMVEFRKTTATMSGFPLLQYASFGLGGTGQPGISSAPSQPRSESRPEDSSQQVSTPGQAAAKAIGSVLGGFGGFGRKKKKQDQSDQQAEQNSAGVPPESKAAGQPGSFMDMTIEVTTYSFDPLDNSLFEIPAGYTQVQGSAERMMGGGQR